MIKKCILVITTIDAFFYGVILKNKNVNFRCFVVSILVLIISASCYAYPNDILIYIQSDIYADYKKFIKNKDITDIKNFSGKNISRDVVDMIIAQKALKLGGFNHQFKYAPGQVNFRNTKMLQNGELLISFDSYWKSDAEALANKLYISKPVIRNGEYIAGIYTSPNNKKVLQVKTLDDLKELTAISTPKWITDWNTLQSLSLKKLVKENSWLSMARMVNIQWIDFILMPFSSSADHSYTQGVIHLVPVKNTAIILKDSRHFVISKAHPQGKAAYIAINKGLTILRKRGEITKAYTQAGFFIDRKKYNILNL